MYKILLVMALIGAGVQQACAEAQHVGAQPLTTLSKSYLKTHITPDKMLYLPGDTVNLAISYENVGVNKAVRYVKADPVVNARMVYFNPVKLDNGAIAPSMALGQLPAVEGLEILPASQQAYATFSFKLKDYAGNNLPTGVYTISIGQPPFIDTKVNKLVYPTESSVYIFVGNGS